MGIFSLILRGIRALFALLAKGFNGLKGTTFGGWLWFTLYTYLGGLIGKLLLLLGVSMVVNQWVTPNLVPYIANDLLAMDPNWVQFMALSKIDQGMTVILSAMGIAVADKISMQRRVGSWQTPL